MIVPNYVHSPLTDKGGNITPSWQTTINQLLDQLQLNFSQTGLVSPSQPSTNLPTIATDAQVGTLVFDETNDELKIRLADGQFHELLTDNSGVESVAGTANEVNVAGTANVVISLANNPFIPGLSVSQAVVTDAFGRLQSLAYTPNNTASTIVSRNGSGNFSAGTITASLTGAASLNVLKIGDTMSGDLSFIGGFGTLYQGSSGSVTVRAQNSGVTTYTLQLPLTQGGAGQYLAQSATPGILEWATGSGGTITSVSGTANRITTTGTTAIIVDIASNYVGQNTITTLGTVGTGTWQGTTVGVAYGGTGQTTYTNGQLLIGNTTGNTLTKATLTGTTNQITVTNGAGSITLSTPQNLNTTANVTFATVTANLTGTATNSTNAAITNDSSTNATMYPVWVTANTGNLPLRVSSTGLTYNPSQAILTTVGGFAGPILLGSSNALSVRAGGSGGGGLTLQGGTSSTQALNTVAFHTSGVPGVVTSWGPFSSSSSVLGNTLLSSTTITSYESTAGTMVIGRTASNVASMTGGGGALIGAASSWSSEDALISLADASTGAATTESITLSSSGGDPRIIFGTSADYISYTGNLIFSTNLLPDSNAGANLGASGTRWNQFYTSNIRWGGQTTLDTNMVVQGPNSVTQQARCFGWTTYSDMRLKENIIDVDPEEDLQKCLQIRTVQYTWKEGYGDNIPGETPIPHLGYLAQDIAQICPEFVGYDSEGVANAVEMSKLSRLHAGAIKALYARIVQLENAILTT